MRSQQFKDSFIFSEKEIASLEEKRKMKEIQRFEEGVILHTETIKPVGQEKPNRTSYSNDNDLKDYEASMTALSGDLLYSFVNSPSSSTSPQSLSLSRRLAGVKTALVSSPTSLSNLEGQANSMLSNFLSVGRQMELGEIIAEEKGATIPAINLHQMKSRL